MPVDEKYWRVFKKRFWTRFVEDVEIGYVDSELIPLIIRLNTDRNIYTMSSCSGRVVFSDSTYPWSREESCIVFKKHGEITVDELKYYLKSTVIRRLWVNVSGPIIHLSVLKPSYIKLVLKLAREAGLKHSGILSVNRYKGYILELVSGVKLSQLIKTPSRVMVRDEDVEELVEAINDVYAQGQRILKRLYKVVFEHIPVELDLEIANDIERRGLINLLDQLKDTH